MVVTLELIQQARTLLAEQIKPTPLLKDDVLRNDGTVYLKAEMMQNTGSFKLRGASFRMRQLSEEERKRGVICASAGNHAQGVAMAAQRLGIPARIVMPKIAPVAKLEATRALGATVELMGDVYDEANQYALTLAEKSGEVYIPAFDDPYIVAGQGTLGLEILEQCPEVEAILVPVGGGGLAAGIACAVKTLRPDVEVWGVEPENAAGMMRSLEAGKVITLQSASSIADGVAVKRVGEVPFALCQQYLNGVVLVEEAEIASAILLMMERAKLVLEGAGATPVAALQFKHFPLRGRNVVLVLSGGNIDMTLIARILDQGLVKAGRRINLRVLVRDRPGELARLLATVAEQGANVLSITHDRDKLNVPIGSCSVVLTLETANHAHIQAVTRTLIRADYDVSSEL